MVAGRKKGFIKAPYHGAFFLFIVSCCLSLSVLAAGACRPYLGQEKFFVSYVYDGDTVRLRDGRKIRLIGINTPEKGHDGKPEEEGAEAALQHLSAILKSSGNLVFVQPDVDPTDRYGRILAHLYDRQGTNITEMMLKDGMGIAISFPPNLQNYDCYSLAEAQARNARRGLWQYGIIPLDVEKLSGDEEGFHLIRGRIERIGKSRRSLWLNLVRGPALRIDWSDWRDFPQHDPDTLQGKQLEVRGWLYHRKGQQRMQVRHPSAIRWLN